MLLTMQNIVDVLHCINKEFMHCLRQIQRQTAKFWYLGGLSSITKQHLTMFVSLSLLDHDDFPDPLSAVSTCE